MSREVGDLTVLLNLETGTYLSVSGSGGELWRLYSAEGYDTAVASASARFGVSPDQIRSDLDQLLRDVATLRAARAPQRAHRPRPSIGRALRAGPLELLTAVRALALVTAVEIGLRTMSLPRLTRLLGVRLASEPEASSASSAGLEALTVRERSNLRAAERVFRYWPFDDTCLRRALVAGRQLRHRGTSLHLGVADSTSVEDGERAAEGEIAAHAWIDAGDVRLLALPGYERLVSTNG
ncbi:MAG: lasso peptide biosynthesis B2 protein [Solirubrobacteraceae bacterium]|nr:lasso peptide biosynthesis B2 protein [Solirubrobacteraceae bacterium]